MNMDGVRYVRDRFNVPVADADLEKNCRTLPFPEGSEEHKYRMNAARRCTATFRCRQPNFTE